MSHRPRHAGVRGAPFRAGAWLVWSLLLSGCASHRSNLPADAGAPLSDAAVVHAALVSSCASVRTLTVELALSGHAGRVRLNGRVLAGFERPGRMRLEGVAPLGPPAFILATEGGAGTLLLPRDQRVVRDAPAADILDALTGIRLTPAELLAVLTGCVTPAPIVTGGHLHPDGWASLDLEGGARLFLRRAGSGWQLRAAHVGAWEVTYPDWGASFPVSVELRSVRGPVSVELRARLSQMDVNVDVDRAAFAVVVPESAVPMSLEALRDGGPLRRQ